MLNFDEAIKIFENSFNEFNKIERIPLSLADGRILASDVIASEDYPKEMTSSMDGYAINLKSKNKIFKIAGISPAGSKKLELKKDDECIQVFTGSIIPKGANAVVPIEFVQEESGFIKIINLVEPFFAIRKVAESYKKGEILLKKGTKLNFGEIGLLAGLGRANIDVFIKPIVGILSSGSELRDVGESLDEGEIYSINNYAINAFLKKLGCEVRIFKIIKDDFSSLKDAIRDGLKISDILITTGGVSVGKFDLIKEILKDYEIIINKVALKPGRHIKIAKSGDKFIFALPGFPNSSITLTNLFIKRLINHYLLQNEQKLSGILKKDFHKKSEFMEFIPARLEFVDGKIFIDLDFLKSGSSAIINNFLGEVALIKMDKDYKANDIVEIFKF